MDQSASEDRLVLKWLQDYTHYICDRLSFPHNQAGGLLQEYLDLTARASAQQSSASPYEQPASYPEKPTSHNETQLAEQFLDPRLLDSRLASHTQDQPPVYPESYDGYRDARPEHEADHLSNSVTTGASGSVPQQQSFPDHQHSGDMMTMDPEKSESSHPFSQPVQAMDRESIGSVKEYDPLWVQKGNVNPEIVEGFQSRMKFDSLFRHGVIRPGDVLTLQVTIPKNGDDTETEAHLTMIGFSKCPNKKNKYPDFAVDILSDPHKQYPLLKACFATHPMFDHLQHACSVNVTNRHWRGIQVFRGQQDLGDLWWVKQAFHTWRDMKDREAEQTGQHFRRRRGKGKEGGAVHFKGAFGWWENGVFQPDPDQGRYRPGG